MDLNTVQSLIHMMESSQLLELEVEQDGLRVCLKKSGGSAPASVEARPTVLPAFAPAPPPAPAPQAAPIPAVKEDQPLTGADIHEITSPMVGTFHELPGDKAIKIGSRVKKGQPVCIVEAMKLMNEIVADSDGEIVWIAAKEGQMVEFGQLIFQYR